MILKRKRKKIWKTRKIKTKTRPLKPRPLKPRPLKPRPLKPKHIEKREQKNIINSQFMEVKQDATYKNKNKINLLPLTNTLTITFV